MKKIFILSKLAVFVLFALMFVASCGMKKKISSKQDYGYQQQQFPQSDAMMGQNGGAPQGMPPGPPPGGFSGKNDKSGQPPKGMSPGGMGGDGNFDTKLIKAALAISEGNVQKQDTSLVASDENQSAIFASSLAKVEVNNSKITTSGNTTSQDFSSFQGLNAGVLGRDNSEIRLSGNTISTTGLGANGVFAYGKSVIYSDNDVINCSAGGGHGIMCSGGGTIYATNVNITTAGRNSAAVATDRGSGVITVDKGKILTTGSDSPGLYSTGKLMVSNSDIKSTGSEIAVIEGSNLIKLTNSNLVCTYPNKWGVMIYQSFSGDAEGADGEFQMENSSLEYTDTQCPMFFVTNSTAYITLTNSEVKAASGILLKAASSRWGQEGSNGGTAVIKTEKQVLNGSLNADKNSQIKLTMADQSALNGAVNTANTAKYVSVTLDDTSEWSLSADSYVTVIKVHIDGNAVQNIKGNNHAIYYNKEKNPDLQGKTYLLQGGGELKAI